jgi:hypothetical protein
MDVGLDIKLTIWKFEYEFEAAHFFYNSTVNKNVDIKFNAHDAFLE